MQIERVSVDSLVFDPVNARKHSKRNIEAIKGSLAKFGQQKPLVVDATGVVIAGNGTLQAAKDLGWKEVDIHRSPLKGAEAIAFALADNKTAELAEWDDDILSEHLAALYKDGWDIEDIGFDASDLDLDSGTDGNTDPDDVPEVEENKFGVERGQIWQLGEHRLMCGDSTDKDDVELLMGGEKADMVFTDPPYGIDLDTDYSSMGDKAQTHRKVHGDEAPFDAGPLASMFSDAKEQFWFGANYYIESFKRSYGEGSWFVWDKYPTDNNDKRFGSLFELIWSKQRHKQVLVRVPSLNVGHFKPEDIVHPTQKPSALGCWFIEKYSQSLDKVVDLFLGSGSTLIACEKTGRKCYGMEIDPHYCSVIIERWQQFTGRQAELVKKPIKAKG